MDNDARIVALYNPQVTGRSHYVTSRHGKGRPTQTDAVAFFAITEVVGKYLTMKAPANTRPRGYNYLDTPVPAYRMAQVKVMHSIVRNYSLDGNLRHVVVWPELPRDATLLHAARRPQELLANILRYVGSISYHAVNILGMS